MLGADFPDQIDPWGNEAARDGIKFCSECHNLLYPV